MSIRDIADRFKAKLTLAGGDPSTCEGVVFMDALIEKRPDMTVLDFVAAVDEAADRGEATRSWLMTGLSLCWADLSEDERLAYFAALRKDGALVSIVGQAMKRPRLTERERDFLRSSLPDMADPAVMEKMNRG